MVHLKKSFSVRIFQLLYNPQLVFLLSVEPAAVRPEALPEPGPEVAQLPRQRHRQRTPDPDRDQRQAGRD